MKKLIGLLSLIAVCYSANCQEKVHFDFVLDISYSFSTNDNKYNSTSVGGTGGLLFLNNWLFLGGGAKVGYDKYKFPLVEGKYWQATIYADAKIYIPVHEMAQVYLDFKLGTCGADPKIQETTSSTVTTYKNLILGGPYKSFGIGMRILGDDGHDVGLGVSYDFYELTIKKNKKPILGAGFVENLAFKLEYYF